MGLTPKEYYGMTRAEFILAFRGFKRKHYKDWEQTRMIAYTTYAVAPKGKMRNKPITKWLPLPSDSDYDPRGLGGIDIEQVNREYEEIMAKINKDDASGTES